MNMRASLLAGLILAGWITPILGTTRYVSRSGSNTPPYDTWEKATDSLGLAFKIANPYDTVRVAAGTFYSDSNEIIFQPNMVLIGAGRDSTHIIRSPVMSAAVIFLIRNFSQIKSIRVSGLGQTSYAIVPIDSGLALTIENNHFEGFYSDAIGLGGAFYDRSFTRIVGNIFESCDQAIDFSVVSGLIQGNIFRDILGTSIHAAIRSPYVTIANNTFGPNIGAAISEGVLDSGMIVNNIFGNIPNHGVIFGGSGSIKRPEINNNHFYKVNRAVITYPSLGRAANNTLVDNQTDFETSSDDSIEKIHHNVIWRTNGTQPTILPNNYFWRLSP